MNAYNSCSSFMPIRCQYIRHLECNAFLFIFLLVYPCGCGHLGLEPSMYALFVCWTTWNSRSRGFVQLTECLQVGVRGGGHLILIAGVGDFFNNTRLPYGTGTVSIWRVSQKTLSFMVHLSIRILNKEMPIFTKFALCLLEIRLKCLLDLTRCMSEGDGGLKG